MDQYEQLQKNGGITTPGLEIDADLGRAKDQIRGRDDRIKCQDKEIEYLKRFLVVVYQESKDLFRKADITSNKAQELQINTE